MEKAIEYIESCVSLFPRLTAGNVIEILIIAFSIYLIALWIRSTNATAILKGIVVIGVFIIICAILQLDTILWIFGKIATVAVTFLIIIFQPELRKALEQLGSGSIISRLFPAQSQSGFTEKTANEIVKAAFELSKTKTGALIVVERTQSLTDIERTGIAIEGLVSSQLLINIFEHNTPLHDGAVVVRGNQITAATCYLPLSDNMSISKAYGTRHRAALGISEITDAITVVVSEETGKVSVTEGGRLTIMRDSDALRGELNKLIDAGDTKKRRIQIKGLKNSR